MPDDELHINFHIKLAGDTGLASNPNGATELALNAPDCAAQQAVILFHFHRAML